MAASEEAVLFQENMTIHIIFVVYSVAITVH